MFSKLFKNTGTNTPSGAVPDDTDYRAIANVKPMPVRDPETGQLGPVDPDQYPDMIKKYAGTGVPEIRELTKGVVQQHPKENPNVGMGAFMAFHAAERPDHYRSIRLVGMCIGLLRNKYNHPNQALMDKLGMKEENLLNILRAVFGKTMGHALSEDDVIAFVTKPEKEWPTTRVLYYDVLGCDNTMPRTAIEPKVNAYVEQMKRLTALFRYTPAYKVNDILGKFRTTIESGQAPDMEKLMSEQGLSASQDVSFDENEIQKMIQEAKQTQASAPQPSSAPGSQPAPSQAPQGSLGRAATDYQGVMYDDVNLHPFIWPYVHIQRAFSASEQDYNDKFSSTIFGDATRADLIAAIDGMYADAPNLGNDLLDAARAGQEDLFPVIAKAFNIEGETSKVIAKIVAFSRDLGSRFPEIFKDQEIQ